MLSEAIKFWDSISGKVLELIRSETQNAMRLERYDVTTAPNGTVMGVTKPFGNNEIFLPYSAEVAGAAVGNPVLVAWWGSMSNAKVYYFADGYRGTTERQWAQLLNVANIPSTATAYACDWSSYDILLINGMFYSNTVSSYVVTKDYFNGTTSTARVLVIDPVNGNIRYAVYKKDDENIYALTESGTPGAAYGIRIYGVKL